MGAARSGRAVVIGEALVDIVRRPGDEPVEHAGGSPANVALALARLGRDVELATSFAPDERGRLLAAHLAEPTLRLTRGSVSAERTSTALADIDATGSASYTFDLLLDPPAPDMLGATHLHVGSIGATLEPSASTVRRAVAATTEGTTVSYDPNCRPSIMGDPAEVRPVVESLVAAADVVQASDDDLAWLAPGIAAVDAARAWASLGPSLVVVTLGAAGALAVTADGLEVRVVAREVLIADTVGAGDAFMAGLLDALWAGGLLGPAGCVGLRSLGRAALTSVLERAALVAALTVARPGSDPPTRAQVEAALRHDPQEDS